MGCSSGGELDGKERKNMKMESNEMPEIEFDCPHCGQKLNSPGDMGGQVINCPVCNKPFQIPSGIVESPMGEFFPAFVTPLEGEKLLALTHPSGLYFLGKYLLGVLCLLVGIVCAITGSRTQSPIVVIGWIAVFGFFYTLWTTVKMLIYVYSHSYVLTNLRILEKKGLVSISTSEVRIADIRGANLRQSILERILDVGSIAIGSAATAGTEVSFDGIKNPREILSLINAQRKS